MGQRIWMNLVVILAASMVPTLAPQAVSAQAVLPRTVRINFGNTNEQALMLAREAAQLAQFQQFDLALPRAQLAAQLAPKAFQTQGILGSIYLQREQYSKAIDALLIAHNLKKDEPSILFTLGSAYLRNKDYQASIQTLQKGLSLSPRSPSAVFDLGNAFFLTKKYDQAVVEYERVLSLDQRFWAATNNIGLVEYERGNVLQSIARWQESLKQAQEIEFRAAEPTLALATAFYRQGQREKAIDLAVEAMKIDPEYGKASHLVENLWGERLMADVQPLLSHPRVRKIIEESEAAFRNQNRRP
ncbi:MAG: tetratricopeptide repeat protein [Oscillatoriales cyanobacterium SM2_2_1]|nr:tetratricopeptide repeat protein [Oscillatoriales cyanobacterium SM2_2_1]